MPLQVLLQILLERPGFCESCEQWRTRGNTEGVLNDVYDTTLY